jgi:undecaprenyl diphosphate synthase
MSIPSHLAIIIDGNRRWAKKNSLEFFNGHKKGMDNVKTIGESCRKKGIKILTLYVFSTENWNRSKKEVNYLMKLFNLVFNKNNINDLHQKGIVVKIIGQIDKLPKALQNKILEAEGLTKNNKKGVLNLAISYGGKADIIQAIKEIVKKKKPINEEEISNHLWTKKLPDPDLIIRTGGEQRLSNFLIWQSAYSELYFTKKLWPDFTINDLDKALKDYSQRQRRFGR